MRKVLLLAMVLSLLAVTPAFGWGEKTINDYDAKQGKYGYDSISWIKRTGGDYLIKANWDQNWEFYKDSGLIVPPKDVFFTKCQQRFISSLGDLEFMHYPSSEIIAINGKPWQKSKYADTIKENILRYASRDPSGLHGTWINRHGGLDLLPQVPEPGHKMVYFYEGQDCDADGMCVAAYLTNETADAKYIPTPTTREGQKMVPLKGTVDWLGTIIGWDAENRRVKLQNGNDTIYLTPGSETIVVNGENKTMAAPAITAKGSTFVPLSFVAHTLGYDVNFEDQTKRIEITN
ncbi:MAG: copper amine oxidase N-terminal domain-containing protein [Peptococcaceae bacterium]|nr:copper amine oxidase N-terminal domain-containing protein [Peptococcaceae bacterium]